MLSEKKQGWYRLTSAAYSRLPLALATLKNTIYTLLVPTCSRYLHKHIAGTDLLSVPEQTQHLLVSTCSRYPHKPTTLAPACNLYPNKRNTMQRLAAGLVPLLLLCSLALNAVAKVEPTRSNKKNLSQLSLGDSLSSSVQLINNDTQYIHRIWNRISLAICSDTNLCYTDSFSFTARFKVLYWNKITQAVDSVDTLSLSISYNPGSGKLYTEKSSYVLQDAYRVTVIPIYYSSNSLKARICLYNEMDVERRWNMNYFISDSVLFTAAPSLISSSGEYELQWALKDWAEEYDLEWTWVDDYGPDGIYTGNNYVQYNFDRNAGRVTVKGNSYRISPVFEHGYVIFRVRPVGYGGSEYRQRLPARWSLPDPASTVFNVEYYNPNALLTINSTVEHQQAKNWQYEVTYAEDGKKKEIIAYFDGSLRNRQTVTRNNSDEMAIVAETYYDHQGRPAVNALPVPAFSQRLNYFSHFNINELNNPYSKLDFDLDTNSCDFRLRPMKNDSGSARYYSASNPLKTQLHHQFIPDARQYPFSQVEYTPDLTGRISSQSGVGADHQLGSGHETKYDYATPAQQELDRLFGTQVGYFKHYRKNMVRDANGQISISYLDAKGRVIATALAGNNPGNTAALANNDTASVQLDLLEIPDTVYSEGELSMSKKILVSADNTSYQLSYSMNSEVFDPACLSSLICYDCVYDLEISLRDECGQEKLPGGQPIVRTIGNIDMLCSTAVNNYSFKDDTSLAAYLGGVNGEYLQMTLQAGAYQLSKTLKVNREALDYYTDKYIAEGLSSGCLLNPDSFERKAYKYIDTTSCEMDCAKCREQAGTQAAFRTMYMTALLETGVTPVLRDTSYADSLYLIRLGNCDLYCDSNDICRTHYMMMLNHVSPRGQYGLISRIENDSAFVSDTLFSVMAIGLPSAQRNDIMDTMLTRADLSKDTIELNGQRRCILSLSPTEMYFGWRPEWAHILVKLHPEYCQYQWCKTNRPSNKYDYNLMQVESYQAALDSGYLNPLASTGTIGSSGINYSHFSSSAGHKDPYFDGHSGRTLSMKALLENYIPAAGTQPAVSTWELMMAVNCAGSFADTAALRTCLQGYLGGLPTANCETKQSQDQYWRIFRGLYLQLKQKMIVADRDASTSNCNAYYNTTRFIHQVVKGLTGKETQIAFMTEPDAWEAMGYSSGSQNKGDTNRIKAHIELYSQCFNQCWGYVDRWMSQLSDCRIDASKKDSFRVSLVNVCMFGCDQQHPLGGSQVLPKYMNSSLPDKSFRDVFNRFAANGWIHTPVADSPWVCGPDLLDFPQQPNHDYFISSLDPQRWPLDSMPDSLYTFNVNCGCKTFRSLQAAFGAWVDTLNTACDSNLHTFINRLYHTSYSADDMLRFEKACTFGGPNGGGISSCHTVVTSIPGVLADTLLVEESDSFEVPRIPFSWLCPNQLPAECMSCDALLREAIPFVQKYHSLPDTAYMFSQIFSNIMNRNHGMNLDYLDYRRALSNCDTIYKLLYAVQYKSLDTVSRLPQTVDAFMIETPMDFAGGKIDDTLDVGTCTCNKLFLVYSTWLDMKQNNQLEPGLLDFAAFAKLNGLELDFDPGNFDMDDLMNKCKILKNIDSLITRTINCVPRDLCVRNNYQDTIYNCPDPPSGYFHTTDTICDTTYTFHYCEIVTILSGAQNACKFEFNCAAAHDSVKTWGLDSAALVEQQLEALYKSEFTVLGGKVPSDTCSVLSPCRKPVFSICSEPTREAKDFFKIMELLAWSDTLHSDSFDLNNLLFFRSSVFNKSKPDKNKICSNQGKAADKPWWHTEPKYPVEPRSYDYSFMIKSDSLGDCEVIFDTLPLSDLNRIFRIYDITPTSVYADGKQYFRLKLMLDDSSIIQAHGYTSCFRVSECCAPNEYICNRPLVEKIVYRSDCKESLRANAKANGQRQYQAYIDSVRTAFRYAYMNRCVQAARHESLQARYNERQHQYTLYYYDQAGNLVQTVPPAGVQFFSGSQLSNTLNIRRQYPDSVYSPAHNLPTVYHYNSLNQLVWQRTPDADSSEFFYERLGRLAFSQNKKQKNSSSSTEKKYSYTLYDALGRVKEVGELRSPYALNHDAARRNTFIDSALSGSRSQITRTHYDQLSYSANNGRFVQKHLRNRVAHITYQDAEAGSYRHAVHYSYDVHGNVSSLLRENKSLENIGQQYKQLDYDYDLISGKVNQVSYQVAEADQFYQRYEYDADNRLTRVYTSSDSVHWDQDARYFYYLHGPLARTEIGQHKVQGMDYAYTIHGWLKGVNSNTLTPERDMGRDGYVSGSNLNRNVARDVFGFSLSYYYDSLSRQDYIPVSAPSVGAPSASFVVKHFEASLQGSVLHNASPNLYNGNIRHMVVAISQFMQNGAGPMAYAYQYDQLNRLLNVNAYNNLGSDSNKWQATGSALPDYHNRFSYDANGNILTQVRRGSATGGLALDSLTYHYRSGSNQLDYVDDAVSSSAYTDDIDDQASGNYLYDEIGNLIKDSKEEIDSMCWTVYGKLKSITRKAGSLKPDLEFEYSPDGQRVCKIVKPKVGSHLWTYTYYVRDAQGNVMATYERRLEALFDAEATNFADVNAELVALHGNTAFKGFIQSLHPLAGSAAFVDSLRLQVQNGSQPLKFVLYFDPTDTLSGNTALRDSVWARYTADSLAQAMIDEYGLSDVFSKVCSHDASAFIEHCYNSDTWYLARLFSHSLSTLQSMYTAAGGSGTPTGFDDLSTYIIANWSSTQIADWISANGGCTLHANILNTMGGSSPTAGADLQSALLKSYPALKTALLAQYSSAQRIAALAQSGTWRDYTWSLIHRYYSTGSLLSYVFGKWTSSAYDRMFTGSYTQYIAPVQDSNNYYSLSQYFVYLKNWYGLYTYQALTAKFISLSQQFKDQFVLEDWNLYGSARLGVQKANRQLLHIRFSGTWNQYAAILSDSAFSDTSNTVITEYSMNYEYYQVQRGNKYYELCNHLGNVMVVINDKRLMICSGDTVNYFTAQMVQASDYSAFGALLPGRSYSAMPPKEGGRKVCVPYSHYQGRMSSFAGSWTSDSDIESHFNQGLAEPRTAAEHLEALRQLGLLQEKATFNGSGYVDFGKHSAHIPGTSDFTLEAWVKVEGSKTYRTILSKLDLSSANYLSGFDWFIYQDNKLVLWTAEEQFGPGNPFAQIQTSGTHDFSNWTHVLVQRIGNNASNWKIYINGVSVAFQIDANQLNTGNIGGLSSSTAKLGLGGFIYDGSVYDQFRGDLKQVRLYKRALSATEISANFANTCNYEPVSQNNLVFWAPLREATTSVSVGDISSTASTGTHSGSGNSMSRSGLSSSTCSGTPTETCVERENGYRYSINTQEKVDEISGEGNHTTAEFWEYDSRLGRRWNVDPVIKSHESPYATFANNPIWLIDPNGADSEKVDGVWKWKLEAGEDYKTVSQRTGIEPSVLRQFTQTPDKQLKTGQYIELISPKFKEGDKIYIVDEEKVIGYVEVKEFRTTAHRGSGGVKIRFIYVEMNSGTTDHNWSQSVWTNDAISKGLPTPYSDGNGGFYNPNSEAITDRNILSDHPQRPADGKKYFWLAESTAIGRNSKGVFIPLLTLTWGFHSVNPSFSQIPFVSPHYITIEGKPTPNHVKNFPKALRR